MTSMNVQRRLDERCFESDQRRSPIVRRNRAIALRLNQMHVDLIDLQENNHRTRFRASINPAIQRYRQRGSFKRSSKNNLESKCSIIYIYSRRFHRTSTVDSTEWERKSETEKQTDVPELLLFFSIRSSNDEISVTSFVVARAVCSGWLV